MLEAAGRRTTLGRCGCSSPSAMIDRCWTCSPQVLVPVGGDLRAVAVDRVINALFDTDREVLRRLDRIEAKLEVLKNKDATSGWQYLKQALEPHRSDAEKKEQVSFALKAFTDAASSAADEPMNRSAARICQAMCWFCLGSPEDVRNRLGEAATDSYDAVYQAAIQYNEPHDTALATRESWVQRHLPGWEVTDRTVARRTANQKASSAERLMKSNPTRPARRLQVRTWHLHLGERISIRRARGCTCAQCVATYFLTVVLGWHVG
jgi:hypothetical protein